ncbi:MAG: response regulator [Hespellia sp.]|nr:response regulator [Hespellia sp.]
MIKVMVCDDEGIVRQSLHFIMDKAFGGECQVEEAKSGRAAIELVQTFRPDIAFMDIQMPGINGIDAMKEMKAENPNMLFIVLTAYDQFGYAKEAIDLGVLEYLTKPIGKDKIIAVMRRAISVIETQRSKKSYELEVQEKLETVIPMIENGYIYSVVLQDVDYEDTGYETLLNIQGKQGFIIVFEFGEDHRNGNLTNPVGSNVKMQRSYMEFRGIMKEYYEAIIGAPMSNKIIVCVPTDKMELEYDERVKLIDKTRAIVRVLEQKLDMKFKVGIGSLKPLELMAESYQEATMAIHQNIGKVTHIKDIPVGCVYDEAYPVETEELLFDALQKGNVEELKRQCTRFLEWMMSQTSVLDNNARLKVMEFVLRAEELAYRHGGMTYQYESRNGFLEEVLNCGNFEQLSAWFLSKMTNACFNIRDKQKEKNIGLVEHAKNYVNEHFANELSLDEISREVNISPYYFSKLFKEESGVNYIEYVTKIRMEHAKKLLQNPENSIKYVCAEVGYSDPNYFSRIFKKWIGKTPSEYREEVGRYE